MTATPDMYTWDRERNAENAKLPTLTAVDRLPEGVTLTATTLEGETVRYFLPPSAYVTLSGGADLGVGETPLTLDAIESSDFAGKKAGEEGHARRYAHVQVPNTPEGRAMLAPLAALRSLRR